MQTPVFKIKGESKLIQGHVLDVSRRPLEAALKRYDAQLYVAWRPSKGDERGLWELRRKPELKRACEGYSIATPRGQIGVSGDIFDCSAYGLGTLVFPKHRKTSHEIVKTFSELSYQIVEWVGKQDLWRFGYKGKDFASESAYREAKYEERIDEESAAEKAYGLRQMRTLISDFRNYINSGGDPYRLMDYWGK